MPRVRCPDITLRVGSGGGSCARGVEPRSTRRWNLDESCARHDARLVEGPGGSRGSERRGCRATRSVVAETRASGCGESSRPARRQPRSCPRGCYFERLTDRRRSPSRGRWPRSGISLFVRAGLRRGSRIPAGSRTHHPRGLLHRRRSGDRPDHQREDRDGRIDVEKPKDPPCGARPTTEPRNGSWERSCPGASAAPPASRRAIASAAPGLTRTAELFRRPPQRSAVSLCFSGRAAATRTPSRRHP
jgi:hypothetical protein